MQSLDRLRRFASMFGRRDTRHSDSSLSGQSDSESPGSADHHAAPIQPGDILGGRFKVLGFLGQGGMGCVYAAEDILLRTSVAVKVIRSEYVADEGRRSRLIREVRLGRLITHPNVCRIYDIEECNTDEGNLLFLTMELLRGETLGERLSRKPQLTNAEAQSLAVQLADALAALHRAGIVHRDFKPGNVMLVDGESGPRAVVMDFGLAHRLEAEAAAREQVTQTDLIAGTPAYMAPEQASGGRVTAASDVYALGLVITEIFTGLPVNLVLERTTQKSGISVAARAILNHAGRRMREPVVRCLELDPARRYPSAVEVHRALTQAPTRSRARVLVWSAAAAGILILAAPFAQRYFLKRLPAERHVAILPFKQVSGDPVEADLLSGMVEAISQDLTHCCAYGSTWFVPASESKTLGTDAALKVRRAFGVNLALTGAATEKNGFVWIELTVLDAASLRRLRSATVKLPIAGLAAGEADLAAECVSLLDVPLRAPLSLHVASATPGALQYRQKALEYLRRSDLGSSATAIALLKKAIAEDSRYASAFADLARALVARYSLTKEPSLLSDAELACAKAQQLNGQLDSGVLVAQAQISHFHGDTAGAIQLLQRAVDKDPEDAQAAWFLADYYDEIGNTLRAEQMYIKAMEAHPGDWRLYAKLGLFSFHHGQYVDAERYYRTACELAPDNVQATYSLGGLLLYLGRYREALTMLQHGVEIKPSAGGYSNLGSALFLDGQFAQAVTAFEHAVELAPFDHRYRRNLGDGYSRLGSSDKARIAYEKALELVDQQIRNEPGNAALMGARALYLAKCNRAKDSRDQVSAAVRSHPDDRRLLFQCAVAMEMIGDRKEGLLLLKDAVAKGLSAGEIQTTYELEQLRKDPAFPALVSKANIN